MDYNEISKKINVHDQLIKVVEEFNWKDKDSKEKLNEYLDATINNLGESLDTLLIKAPVRILGWHKGQKHQGSTIGVPVFELNLDDYMLQPGWTRTTGGRFGTAIPSHPVLVGSDSSKKFNMEFDVVKGDRTFATGPGYYHRELSLENKEGMVFEIICNSGLGSLSRVLCTPRSEAPGVINKWFTDEVRKGTGMVFFEAKYEKTEEEKKAHWLLDTQNIAMLKNGWQVSQRTPHLGNYGKHHTCFSQDQKFTITRPQNSVQFDLEEVHELVKEKPKLNYSDAYTVKANGILIRKPYDREILSKAGQDFLYQLDKNTWYSAENRKKDYWLVAQEYFGNNGWKNVTKLEIMAHQDELNVGPLRKFLKGLAEKHY